MYENICNQIGILLISKTKPDNIIVGKNVTITAIIPATNWFFAKVETMRPIISETNINADETIPIDNIEPSNGILNADLPYKSEKTSETTQSPKYGTIFDTMISLIDILIDGKFIEEQKDLHLRFRGSANQRIIDVQKSLKENITILWDGEQYI